MIEFLNISININYFTLMEFYINSPSVGQVQI